MIVVSLLQYINNCILVLIPLLLLVGIVFKKLPFIHSLIIPCVIFGLGMIGGFILFYWSLFGIIQGFLCAGTAIGINQFAEHIYKYIFSACDKDEPDNDEENKIA